MNRWKRVAMRLHGVVGMAVGLFIAISGLTGAVIAFEPDFPWRSGHEIEPPSRDQARSLAELIWTVTARYPQYTPSSLILPEQADKALIVNLLEPVQRKFLAVFVDPYTAAILGDSDQRTDRMRLVRRLHTGAALGVLGFVMVAGAIGAVVLVPSGLWLWWRGRRKSCHARLGVVASVFLLIFAVTALKPIPMGLRGRDPIAPLDVKITPGASRLSPDTLVRIAESALSGAQAVSVGLGGTYLRSPADIYLRQNDDRTADGRSIVFIDPYTGAVTGLTNPHAMGLMARYAWQWNEELHTGAWGGSATRRASGTASAAIALLAFTGLLRWRSVGDWGRRPRTTSR